MAGLLPRDRIATRLGEPYRWERSGVKRVRPRPLRDIRIQQTN